MKRHIESIKGEKGEKEKLTRDKEANIFTHGHYKRSGM
jgi:hypothetical protein